MIKKYKISLVLPCRNEASHLSEVIDRVPQYIDEILVVSNKSTDNTVKVAKKLAKKDSRVVALEDNRTINGIGYGFAHMTGINAATGDVIIGADGDATYPIEDSKKIVEYALKDDVDFVACHRYPLQEGVKIPFKLQLGVNLLNWEVRLLYGVTLKDTLSGMWVFRSTIKDELRLTEGDWNLSPQIKINAARNSAIKFAQYSIAQHQRLGETKQDYFKTGFNHAVWILKNRLNAPSSTTE